MNNVINYNIIIIKKKMMTGNINTEYRYITIIAKTWNEVYLAENLLTKQKCCIKQVLIDE